MKDAKALLAEKVKKHEEKLKAHKQAEQVLKIERDELEKKLANADSKILSTVKSVEYHTGKLKAYQKAFEIIE